MTYIDSLLAQMPDSPYSQPRSSDTMSNSANRKTSVLLPLGDGLSREQVVLEATGKRYTVCAPSSVGVPRSGQSPLMPSDDFPSPVSSMTASPPLQSPSAMIESRTMKHKAIPVKSPTSTTAPSTANKVDSLSARRSSLKLIATASAVTSTKSTAAVSSTVNKVPINNTTGSTARSPRTPGGSQTPTTVGGIRWTGSTKTPTATRIAGTTNSGASDQEIVVDKNIIKHGWVQKEDLKAKTKLFKPFTHQYFVLDALTQTIKYASTPKVISFPTQIKGCMKLLPGMSVNTYKKPVDRTLMVEIVESERVGNSQVRMRFIVDSLEEQNSWSEAIIQAVQLCSVNDEMAGAEAFSDEDVAQEADFGPEGAQKLAEQEEY
jgi:hypothetical protein